MTEEVYPGYVKSALARARKVLKAEGLPLFKSYGRYQPFCNPQRFDWGVKVTRVGCSKTIALHVRMGERSISSDDRPVFERALVALRKAGLPFDDRGWLGCSYAD